MHIFKNMVIAFSTILFMASCVKEIEYKGKNKDSLLVLNSITEGDSTIKVKLELSRFFLQSSNGNSAVTTGAQLTLTDQTSGAVYNINTVDADGNYAFPATAIPGNSYAISVIYPGYKTLNSTMTVPVAIPILSVDTNSQNGTSTDGFGTMKALVKWNDPIGEDYYMIKISVVNAVTNNVDIENVSLASTDPNLDEVSSPDNTGAATYLYPQLFFKDQLFDGKQKSLEIEFSKVITQPGYHYKFMLYRCSQETYKYLVSVEKAVVGGGPFSEPVKVFSNIENGYGIFSSMSAGVFVK